MGLQLLDILLTVVHFLIIGFNLFAWIFPATRRLHLYGAAITLGCWFILGLFFGIGYCPVTDWQWNVKTLLGEQHLPNSFVKYYLDKLTGHDVASNLVDVLTVGMFLIAIGISVYLNFFRKKDCETLL